MKRLAIIGGVVVLLGSTALGGAALAETETERLNHDVQRLWDNTFDPHRDGDRAAWERHREAERHDWCRGHHDFDRCGPYR